MNNWYYIAVIVGMLCYTAYKTTELYFDRMDNLQKQSQVVIER